MECTCEQKITYLRVSRACNKVNYTMIFFKDRNSNLDSFSSSWSSLTGILVANNINWKWPIMPSFHGNMNTAFKLIH